MSSSNKEPDITHHRLPNYYDRRQYLIAELHKVIAAIKDDDVIRAKQRLESAELKLRNLERG